MADTIQYSLVNTNTTNYTSNRLYLKDNTVYPLPSSRSSIALLLQSIYKTSKGDKAASVERYNPLTATGFTAIIGADGWYEFNMYALPIYDFNNTANYNAGEVYYSEADSSPLIIIVGPGGFKRTKLVDISSLLDSQYLVSTLDTLSVANNTKVMLRINGMISDLLTNNVDLLNKKLVRLKGNYDTVRIILQGSIYEYARGNKSVCQKNLEFLNTNDYTKV